MAEFIARHEHANLTAKLDQVYAAQPSRLEPKLRRAQGRALRAAEW